MDIPMRTVKILFLLVFVLIYCFILPYGFEVIGPCDGTPEYNYNKGYILLCLFPVVTGLLAYYLFLYKDKFEARTLIITVLLSVACLFVALIITAGWFWIAPPVAAALSGTPLFSWFFHYDCYEDITINGIVFNIIFAMNTVLCGFIACRVVRKRIGIR